MHTLFQDIVNPALWSFVPRRGQIIKNNCEYTPLLPVPGKVYLELNQHFCQQRQHIIKLPTTGCIALLCIRLH